MAWRGIRKQPGYSILNIAGLAIGVAATLFILLYISIELRYDRFHERADRIYRVSSDITEPDDAFRWAVTQIPLAMQLKTDYPEVEQYVRFIPNGRTRLQHNDRYFFEEDVFFVDSTVNDVFTLDFIHGDPSSALVQPNTIVLSYSVAQRIFGKNNPIGEILKSEDGRDYAVTGVYEDFPTYSHLIPNALISSNSIPGFSTPDAESWGGFGIYTYVLLRSAADPKAFEAKLSEVVKKYVAVIFDQFNIAVKYELIGLTDIHLKSDFEGEPEPVGEIGFLYIFGAVALLMLMLACINYMNLSTSRSTKRAMEVGIRKVLGSERRQLILQFLAESLLFSVFALILSFAIVFLLLPLFNLAFDLQLERSSLFSPPILIGIILILILTGIIGGSYPAFYLSSFKPISILKGTLSIGTGNPRLRQVLVIIQFAITIFMLTGTGIIYDQMKYLRNKDLGFNKEHILTFSLQGQDARGKFNVIKQQLLQNPSIEQVASASTRPGEGFGKQVMSLENADGQMDEYGVDNYFVDYDFFPTLNIPFVAGRNFSLEFGTDTTMAAVINESMAKRMGWENPIGKKVQFEGNDTLPIATVIGVVKDFHQQSLYEPISPLLFRPNLSNRQIHVKFKPQDEKGLQGMIAYVRNTWEGVFPNQPFEYDFVDAAFMKLYEADQVRARIFSLFSIMMILIACLGLLGLASFTAEQRTKEIGIRKILGARTDLLVLLLTRNFVLLAVIAATPAFIAAWYFMGKWLETFSYHTTMNVWLFALPFVIVTTITLVTTGYHALRAALSNPVNSLRNQ